jgi:hypothetical protein
MWREMILPHLLAKCTEKELALRPPDDRLSNQENIQQFWGFSTTTAFNVMTHEYFISMILNSITRCSAVVQAMGTPCLLAIIDHAVDKFRYFIDNKPDYDPVVNPPTSRILTSDGVFDFDHLQKETGRPSYRTRCSHTFAVIWSLKNLMEPKILEM